MMRASKATIKLPKNIQLKATNNSAAKVNIIIIRFIRRIRLPIR